KAAGLRELRELRSTHRQLSGEHLGPEIGCRTRAGDISFPTQPCEDAQILCAKRHQLTPKQIAEDSTPVTRCSGLEFRKMVLPAGFEPAISGVRFRNPGPLDDDSVMLRNGSWSRARTCRPCGT